MKKIFPIISLLTLLSLLGLIFFQFMWLKTAKEVKEQQFRQNLILATGEAGEKLVQDHTGFIPLQKKSDLLFPSDRMQNEYFKPSVIQRYSKEEISEIIRKALDNHLLGNIHFEFAIT